MTAAYHMGSGRTGISEGLVAVGLRGRREVVHAEQYLGRPKPPGGRRESITEWSTERTEHS